MSNDDLIQPPGYNTPIPASILTPKSVETRIGTLNFNDGLPTQETADLVFEQLDFSRGVKVFLDAIPAASLEALRRGMVDIGVLSCNHVGLAEQLMDSNPLFLTGNTDTVYASAFLDLERDGATVVEIPEGCGPGTVNDAWFRFVVDMGIPGEDKGDGGKYLILPPDSDDVGIEDLPDGFIWAGRSPTYVNWLILRGFLNDEGLPDDAVEMFKTGLKIYPQSAQAKPPGMAFKNFSRLPFNTIHANTFAFYEELNQVIQKEPVEMIGPELRGLIASIGIEKKKESPAEFVPDERMKKILTEAAAVGNATARALVFKPRDQGVYLYPNDPDKKWKTAFVGGSHEWLVNDGLGGRNLDARTLFFYFATVNTPAVTSAAPGVGSQYAYADKDVNGDDLHGANTYKLNIPADVPALDFWSVVIYDPQTRSQLQMPTQPFPSKNSKRDALEVNPEDGSIDLYFGPVEPADKQNNWIQTVGIKHWFAMLRLYGPTERWFDGSWKPGEIEPWQEVSS